MAFALVVNICQTPAKKLNHFDSHAAFANASANNNIKMGRTLTVFVWTHRKAAIAARRISVSGSPPLLIDCQAVSQHGESFILVIGEYTSIKGFGTLRIDEEKEMH